jgi:hypothetical protein
MVYLPSAEAEERFGRRFALLGAAQAFLRYDSIMVSRPRRWWPLFLLLPIPISARWLTDICLTLFCFLIWLVNRIPHSD